MSRSDWDKQLPPHVPDDADALAAETVTRWQASQASRATRQRAVGAMALLAALIVLTVLIGTQLPNEPATETPMVVDGVPRPGPRLSPGMEDTIEASSDADYALSGPAADRLVELSEGQVLCDVEHRTPGERFRVAVGPSMVEVTGTRFGVEADGDVLRAVWVEEGQVVLRHEGQVLVLNAGNRWPSPPEDDSAPSPEKPARPETIEANEPPPSQDPRVGQYLRQGLTHLDNGDHKAAVMAFAGEQRLGVLAEEAHFYEAVTLRLGGQPDAASAVMDAFIQAYPRSTRLGEVHCMRGKLALESQDYPRAQAELKAAAADRNPTVQRCGESGLSTLP